MSEPSRPPSDTTTPGPESAPTKPKKRSRRRFWLVLTLAVLLAGEVGLRVFADKDSRFNIRLGASQEWDAHRKHRWTRNSRAGDLVINSRGFVGGEFDEKKALGSYRIVCLGDSASVIPPRRPYPAALEEKLRQACGGRRIDVINAGCSGYDSIQAEDWYRREIDAIEHDMLIVYIGWNDMGKYNPDGLVEKRYDAGYLREPTLFEKMILNVYLLRTLYVVNEHRLSRGNPSLEPLNADESKRYEQFEPDHFEKHLTAIVKLAQSRGRKVYLTNYAGLVREHPTDDELQRIQFPRGMGKKLAKYLILKAKFDAALVRVSNQTQAPIIDIAAEFDTPEKRKCFTDASHFLEEGSDRIAGCVAGRLLRDDPGMCRSAP